MDSLQLFNGHLKSKSTPTTKEWYTNKLRFYAKLFFLYARRKIQAMQGIGEAF